MCVYERNSRNTYNTTVRINVFNPLFGEVNLNSHQEKHKNPKLLINCCKTMAIALPDPNHPTKPHTSSLHVKAVGLSSVTKF
jgi:hypothetical protein